MGLSKFELFTEGFKFRAKSSSSKSVCRISPRPAEDNSRLVHVNVCLLVLWIPF